MSDTLNLLDYLDEYENDEEIQKMISSFSCDVKSGITNQETKRFLSNNAIQFSKQKISITYLALNKQYKCVGFYTLAHKPIVIKKEGLSNSVQKRINRYARYDPSLEAYIASGFLIAQLSKNFNLPKNDRISGDKLMEMALSDIVCVQRKIGGGIVFLECEDKKSLLDFYCSEQNKFRKFGERISEEDGVKYIQLLRVL